MYTPPRLAFTAKIVHQWLKGINADSKVMLPPNKTDFNPVKHVKSNPWKLYFSIYWNWRICYKTFWAKYRPTPSVGWYWSGVHVLRRLVVIMLCLICLLALKIPLCPSVRWSSSFRSSPVWTTFISCGIWGRINTQSPEHYQSQTNVSVSQRMYFHQILRSQSLRMAKEHVLSFFVVLHWS